MIDHIDLLRELAAIDEQVMQTSLNLQALLNQTEPPNLNYENTLFLYDGDPIITKKLVQSNIKNCLLYPSHSYLAVNKFLVSDCNHLHLILELNDFRYREVQDIFDHIVVINEPTMYEELKDSYQNLEYIEI